MDMTVLNTNFEIVAVLDTYESIIWVDKLYEPGTFEFYTVFTPDILKVLKPNYYIQNSDSNHTMIIEDTSIESDSESGDHIKVIGRSLESILDRRIVWKKTNFSNYNLQNAIQKLINDAIITPSITDRRIYNFIFVESGNEKIESLKITNQYNGETLLEVINAICSENKIGYKIILNSENQFEFQLYLGEDRSYRQSKNPYVTFSPDFDNLINSNYTDKTSGVKNIALVVGSDKTKVVGVASGINRRELYVEASDLQKEEMSSSKYNALLEKRGTEKISEANVKSEFDCKCDTSTLYIYGKDFFLGDTVQIRNEYGIESSATVTEFTWNYSSSGNDTYPTFTPVEGGNVTGKNKLETTLDMLQDLNPDPLSGEWTDNVFVVNDLTITANLGYENRITGITIDGTNSSSSQVVFIIGKILGDNTDLILSGCEGGSDSTYYLDQYDATASKVGVKNYSGDTRITSITIGNYNEIRFVIKAKKSVDMLTLYPMVRLISEDSAFEPYDPSSQEVNS